MKTAEEWIKERAYRARPMPDWIRTIQLDAWKQGMTDAASMVRGSKQIGRLADKIFVSDEVLTTRDNKTTL